MGSGNTYTPATATQIRYIIQWFQEWSEMQRADFLPILSQKLFDKDAVNGLILRIDSCDVEDRPPSIFQCRIKLFIEWCENWTLNDKDQLVNELRSVDAEFVKKVENRANGTVDTEDETLTSGNTESVVGEC